MATYLNVVIYKDGREEGRHFKKVSTEETVGDMIGDLIGEKDIIVASIITSSDDSWTGGTETPSDTPVHVLQAFNCRYVRVYTKQSLSEASEGKDARKKDAFSILLQAQKSYSHLPSEKPPSTAKNRLYNQVLVTLRTLDVGFTPMQLQGVGAKIVGVLADALWYLDPHHSQMANRCIQLPAVFSELEGYNDWRHHRKKMPMVTAAGLHEHLTALGNMLMMPWYQNSRFQDFRKICEDLADCIKRFHSFYVQQQDRTAKNHASKEPIRSISDAWVMDVHDPVQKVSEEYQEINDAIQECDVYEKICLQDFGPKASYDRKKWISEIAVVDYPIAVYTHHSGNYLGNLHFIWKIPVEVSERDDSKNIDVLFNVREELPIYHTRAMRRDFMQRYGQLPNMKPALLRNMYRFLTDDAAAAESSAQSAVDDRVMEFLLAADDPALMYDLRSNNGRPVNQSFNPFWTELQKYLDEQTVVHERRHSDHLYLPFAISVEDLVSQISKRLPANSIIPSASTVRLNFWPSNPYTASAMKYSGRFKVKYAVQQRLLRAQHPDAPFAIHLFTLLKSMAVKYQENSVFLCLDDKANIPVGEPEKPVSTGVRAQNRSLAPATEAKLVALDHDFHVSGVTPSVLFKVDIPDDARDSFYTGQVHVTVKDKVFQPSSAIRHATETLKIVRATDAHEDDVHLDKPILFLYTDGGPDHRSTFWTVQLSLLMLFVALDLDLLVSARTAPSQSYNNPAERMMSLLNLSLQNCALSRDKMDEVSEYKMKSMSSMQKIRTSKDKEFQKNLAESMEPVIDLLKNRFRRLKRQGESVQVHDAATDGEIQDLAQLLNVFDVSDGGEGIDVANLKTKKDLVKYPALGAFFHNHCRQRHYSFQIMKCGKDTCSYCSLNPPRLPDDTFEELNWLPDPVQENDEYKSFSDVYGTETTDHQRPSLQLKPKPNERDLQHKKLFVAGRVRGFVLCRECGKRRVFYSVLRLTRTQLQAVLRLEEELLYVCGNTLFPEGPNRDLVVTKEALTCTSPMEVTYYAGGSLTFAPACFHCGDTVDLYDGEAWQAALKEFSIVRPICISCHNRGKAIVTRNALKVGKKRK